MGTSGHERRQAVVDAACAVAGAAIVVTAGAAAVRDGSTPPAALWVLLAASVAVSTLLSNASRRRGRTALVAWDDVFLAPAGALVAVGPAIVVHVLGGLVTSLAMRVRPGVPPPWSRLLTSTGRDAVAAGVQVTVVASLLAVLPQGAATLPAAVVAGLVVRWVVEQGLLLVRVLGSGRRLVRPVVVDPVVSFGPTGLAIGGLLAFASVDAWSSALAATVALVLLARVTQLERQVGEHEQAAGVLTLSMHLPDDGTADELSAALVDVAARLWPDDRVCLERELPTETTTARWSSVGEHPRRQWLVLRRTPGRRPPDALDQALLDGLTQVVNGALARSRLVQAMQDQQTLRNAVLVAVAHDIRGPCTMLTGGATTMRAHADLLDDEQRTLLLDRMARAGRRMDRLVQDLLDLERFELADGPALTDGRSDPLAVVARLAEDLELAERIHVTAGPTTPWAAMPERLLARVVENLLTNADKHAPTGSRIWVSYRACGDTVRIEVDDEGAGIPTRARTAVFAAFEQLDGLHTHGLGLGLYVVGCFVRACGGRVWVDDSPHGGASFRVELPAALADPAVAGVGAPAIGW